MNQRVQPAGTQVSQKRRVLVAVVATAALAGVLAAWSGLSLDVTLFGLPNWSWMFAGAALPVALYLGWNESNPWGVLGRGLVVGAGLVALKPIVLFGPPLFLEQNVTSLSATFGVEGILSWGGLSVVAALALYRTGLYLKESAEQAARSQRNRTSVRTDAHSYED